MKEAAYEKLLKSGAGRSPVERKEDIPPEPETYEAGEIRYRADPTRAGSLRRRSFGWYVTVVMPESEASVYEPEAGSAVRGIRDHAAILHGRFDGEKKSALWRSAPEKAWRRLTVISASTASYRRADVNRRGRHLKPD
jgi:hypothetical protein